MQSFVSSRKLGRLEKEKVKSKVRGIRRIRERCVRRLRKIRKISEKLASAQKFWKKEFKKPHSEGL